MRRHAQAPWTVGARRRAHLSVAQIPLRDAGPAGSAAGARHRGECEGSEARRHLRPDFSAPRSSGMATSAPARTAVPSSSVIAITRRRKAGRNYSHEPRYRRSTRGSRYTRTTKCCLTEQDLSSTRRVAVIMEAGTLSTRSPASFESRPITPTTCRHQTQIRRPLPRPPRRCRHRGTIYRRASCLRCGPWDSTLVPVVEAWARVRALLSAG